eukprot:TRINITY_DN13338_c0_g1_i1.p1 TRINITY_DN13338_c0_g1~~TRINITY_DN13338_c0_g1_i1.p1  ORF type:complete len:525 (+),score=111.18 TRINITY_DN13338_c0_g1_i1:31-1575(+)
MSTITVVDDGTTMDISTLNLHPHLLMQLERMQIDHTFPIQASVIPFLLEKHIGDACVSAPTGSGKTLAYILPVANAVLQRVVPRLRALIVLPTRDLALQVRNVLGQLLDGTSIIVESAVGQCSFAEEQTKLVTELAGGETVCRAEIVVATPGRLIDHIQQTRGFTLEHLRYLVIDEADRLLAQSYQDWVSRVLDATVSPVSSAQQQQQQQTYTDESGLHLTVHSQRGHPLDPSPTPLQKLLFSATLTKNPQKIASLRLNAPVFFTCSTTGRYVIPQSLHASWTVCAAEDKPLVVVHLLRTRAITKALCFAASVESTHRLYRLLELFGEADVAEYSSTLPPAKRTAILSQFRAGTIKMIICSDGMARGLDIDDVDHVINYDVPVYVRALVHRIGRTARAGRAGNAYTLLTKQEVYHYKEMLAKTDLDTRSKKMKIDSKDIEEFVPHYKTVLERLKDVLEHERHGYQSSMHKLAPRQQQQHSHDDPSQPMDVDQTSNALLDKRLTMLKQSILANIR